MQNIFDENAFLNLEMVFQNRSVLTEKCMFCAAK